LERSSALDPATNLIIRMVESTACAAAVSKLALSADKHAA